MQKQDKDYIGKMINGTSYLIPIKKNAIIINEHMNLLNAIVKNEPKDDIAYFYIKKEYYESRNTL
jgi:hypothetical protein